MDCHECAFCDEFQVQRLNQLFEKHHCQAFKAKHKSYCFKLFFMIRPIHGRNTSSDMPFVINIFNELCFLR